MGGCQSKRNVLSHLDDSVKVMVRHDAKMLEKKGQKPSGYVPRAPHPLMTDEKGTDGNDGNTNENKNDNGNSNHGNGTTTVEGAPLPPPAFGPGVVITE